MIKIVLEYQFKYVMLITKFVSYLVAFFYLFVFLKIHRESIPHGIHFPKASLSFSVLNIGFLWCININLTRKYNYGFFI